MATLEIHDGSGRVEFATIGRDRVATLGSSPKCDVVLGDPSALPFHARIRFSHGLYKVEAFPEAHSVDLNGRNVLASKMLAGDELRIGDCRVFLTNVDDVADDERTVVRPAPVAAPISTSASTPASPASRPAPLPRAWSRGEVAGGHPPDVESTPASLKRAAAPSPERPERIGRGSSPLRRLMRAIGGGGARPGEERLAGSPLVLGLVLTLVTLVLISVGLWSLLAKTTADRQYQQAMDDFNEGDYPNSIALFDLFLKSSPKDRRAGKARVTRALANVRRYSGGAGALWGSALEAAREMASTVGREPTYDDSAPELAEIVVRAGEAMADRARTTADAKALAEAEGASSMLDTIAGPSGPALRGKSRLPQKIADGRAAVLKADVRRRAIGAMEAAQKAGSAAGVYAARNALIAAYPDLGADRSVVDHLRRANDLLRAAVAPGGETRAAESTPRAGVTGPATTLVLRNPPARPPAAPAVGPRPVVFALVDGSAYGLDGLDGAPLWSVDVGGASPFIPVPVAGPDPGALVVDARTGELMRVSAATGALAWRLELGATPVAAPLVLGNEAYQPMPTGDLLRVDLRSGAMTGSLRFPMPLGPTPTADEAGQYLYLPADSAAFFVVARDPFGCVGVEYTGHDPGSIPCAPARAGSYLILAENHALNEGRWTVLAVGDEGRSARVAQSITVPGWTWETPPTAGAVAWSATDRMGLSAFAIADAGARLPLRPIAATIPDVLASGPAFARARTERELIVAAGRSARFDLDPERQAIATAWTQPSAGAGIAPTQAVGRQFVLTQQSTEGRGVVVSSVGTADGSVAWRTVLGAPWAAEPTPTADGGSLAILSTDASAVVLSADRLAAGGFVEQPAPAGVDRALPPGPISQLRSGDLDILIPTPTADHILIRRGSAPFRRVDLPAPLGAAPLLWGGNLLTPGEFGRAFLIDPTTGASAAEPFVPPYDRTKPTRWLAPARIDDDGVILADASGRVRRLVRVADPRPRLTVAVEVDLGSPIAADPAACREAIVAATADGKVRSLSPIDLKPIGAWPLANPRAFGPVASGGHAFVADARGNLLAFGPDGRRLWSIDLGEGGPVAPPVVRDALALILGRDGGLAVRNLSDGAASTSRVDLEFLPDGGLWPVGPDVAAASGPGSIRLIRGVR